MRKFTCPWGFVNRKDPGIFLRSLNGHRNVVDRANRLWNVRRGSKPLFIVCFLAVILSRVENAGDAVKLLEYAGIKVPSSSADHVPMPAILELELYRELGIGGLLRDELHGVMIA